MTTVFTLPACVRGRANLLCWTTLFFRQVDALRPLRLPLRVKRSVRCKESLTILVHPNVNPQQVCVLSVCFVLCVCVLSA